MQIVRLVSALHVSQGLSLMILPYMPRPVGNFEPYLAYVPRAELGLFLVVVAVLPHLVWQFYPRTSWKAHEIYAASIFPQTFVLFWGFVWCGSRLLEVGVDPRLWLAMCFFGVMTFFHSLSAAKVYAEFSRVAR